MAVKIPPPPSNHYNIVRASNYSSGGQRVPRGSRYPTFTSVHTVKPGQKILCQRTETGDLFFFLVISNSISEEASEFWGVEIDSVTGAVIGYHDIAVLTDLGLETYTWRGNNLICLEPVDA